MLRSEDSSMNLGVESLVKNSMGRANLEAETAKRRSDVVDWLNNLFPDFDMPVAASEEELRARLYDGTVLCGVLNRLNLGSLESPREVYNTSEQRLDYVKRFLSTMEDMGLQRFNLVDLEQGSLSPVVECLLSLKDSLCFEPGEDGVCATANYGSQLRKRWQLPEGDASAAMDAEHSNRSRARQNYIVFGEERRRNFSGLKLQQLLQSPVMSEPSTPSLHHVGNNFHDVLQLKQGRCSDLPVAKISEILKSSSLNNAPTQSLLSIVNGILDESIERKNGEVPQRVARLVKKVVQEIERRLATQAEHIRNQNNLIKAREEKYKSRIGVLETLANGTNEETQIVMSQLQVLKMEKLKIEEKKKLEEQDVVRLMKAKEDRDQFITELKQELEMTNKMYEHRCQQLESQTRETALHLNQTIKELEFHLEESRKRIKELEASSESKFQNYNKKETIFQNFIGLQLQSVQDLRMSSESIKGEVIHSRMRWQEEMINLGLKLNVLVDAAENYHTVVAENQKLYNEVQELKGNIRVCCRIRPFLSGQSKKLTTIDYVGENGELLVANPFKQGKDGHRMFKFNKVFGPAASQEEVFSDIQPLIRSVLDGYNVCIFAYGQTGSGKTYTMSGPHSASKEDWGVNYRALNDLFEISRNRRNSFIYEVGVQMVEIYNERVRDLLSNDGSQKRLGIWSTSQPNGLVVPDASMLPVKSTLDVLELMQIGQANRAVGSTALNERSSRSHSILTVHVRGTDLKTGSASRGCLHLIDLAGSERVERSEATGDRLKEAQHINKSLSALGDVIFALAQKSTHVPYRNSKLTQVLQSSLGGQAKTLMFVQINPDVESYSETISTLKFAERVSGVELGAARSNKEGKDVKDLLEQVASLKDTIARKDEEIEQLQLLKGLRTQLPTANNERCDRYIMKHSSSTLGISYIDGITQQSQQLSGARLVKPIHKTASEADNYSEHSDNNCELTGGSTDRYFHANVEPSGFGGADSDEILSEMSDGGISVGTETDVSVNSATEYTPFCEASKPAEAMAGKMRKVSSRMPRPLPTKAGLVTSSRPKLKDPTKSPSTRKTATSQATASSAKPAKPRSDYRIR